MLEEILSTQPDRMARTVTRTILHHWLRSVDVMTHFAGHALQAGSTIRSPVAQRRIRVLTPPKHQNCHKKEDTAVDSWSVLSHCITVLPRRIYLPAALTLSTSALARGVENGKWSRTSYSHTLVGKITTSSATSSSKFWNEWGTIGGILTI